MLKLTFIVNISFRFNKRSFNNGLFESLFNLRLYTKPYFFFTFDHFVYFIKFTSFTV